MVAWLLDVDGTHRLGDAFRSIFIAEVNRESPPAVQFGPGPCLVSQEVTTAEANVGADIAHLVLESADDVIVAKNFVIYHVFLARLREAVAQTFAEDWARKPDPDACIHPLPRSARMTLEGAGSNGSMK